MAERKRLPVLQDRPKEPAPEAEAEDERPPWHWIGFGAVAIFAAWLPLEFVAAAVIGRILALWYPTPANQDEAVIQAMAMTGEDRMKLAVTAGGIHALAFALACFGGGFLVGRFGRGPTTRVAVSAGVFVALVAIALAWKTAGGVLWVFLLVPFAAAFAALGARVGKKKPENVLSNA